MTLTQFLELVLAKLQADKEMRGSPRLGPICRMALKLTVDLRLNEAYHTQISDHMSKALNKRGNYLYIGSLVWHLGAAKGLTYETINKVNKVTDLIRRQWLEQSIATGVLQPLPDDAQIKRLLEQLK